MSKVTLHFVWGHLMRKQTVAEILSSISSNLNLASLSDLIEMCMHAARTNTGILLQVEKYRPKPGFLHCLIFPRKSKHYVFVTKVDN